MSSAITAAPLPLGPAPPPVHVRTTRAIGLFRCLASLQLAVILLLLLAAVLAAGTIVETYYGAATAHWYVYRSTWFCGLLGLLAVNVVAAAVVRIPWQRHQTGFVVTHAGLLTLLIGAAVSVWGSQTGEITLQEGDSTTEMVVTGRTRITAYHVGRPDDRPYEFSFVVRPFDWGPSRSLQLGEVDGVSACVAALIHHPRVQERWVADESRIGCAAIRFKVSDATGRHVAESWLVDQQFGEPGNIGPLQMRLERAVNAAMLEDFRDPPTQNLGDQGLLLAYYGDDVVRIPVDDNVGRSLPLGGSGVRVEVVESLANARPDRLGRFTSADDRPLNPMLELRVDLPDAAAPLRQVAFAKDPTLNLDGVYGRLCPVTFRYHHPAVASRVDVALLQTSDGKLFGRMNADGHSTFCGEIAPGETLDVYGGFKLHVVDYLPHAMRQISFKPAPHAARRPAQDAGEPAALIELTVDGAQQQVWMRRNDPLYGHRIINTASGAIVLQFEHARAPLGFALHLVDFERKRNPGGVGDAAFTSRVRLVDEQRGVDAEHVISMNEPLTYAGRTFYQANFDEAGRGRESSTLSVSMDPGRPLKFAGGLLVCLGIAIMFYMRAYFFRGHSAVGKSISPDAAMPLIPVSNEQRQPTACPPCAH